MISKPAGRVKLLTANGALAHAVLLCRPDIIAAYPITPQTPVIEKLAQFCADGVLKATTVEVEGENSALSVLIGAATAGGRTFSATSSQGLAFMYEPYTRVPIYRLPIVLAVASREVDTPPSAGHQDAIQVRDAGWIQIYGASCQEILDSTILAYRLAEDPEIFLPVNVIYEGYYLSHLSDRVEIPDQESVDAFLPPFNPGNYTLDPRHPMVITATATPFLSADLTRPIPVWRATTEYRRRACTAMERVKAKFDELDQEFGRRFGRSHGGAIEEYRVEDAEVVLVTMGSCFETAREIVDRKRDAGVRMGLVRVRLMRPFPKERLAAALAGKKAIGVLDRNVAYGWNSGALFSELKSALYDTGAFIPMISFIDGLAGSDITIPHLEKAMDITADAAGGKRPQETVWLALE